MGFFFVDESIHREAGFILAGIVYCEQDPQKDVDQCLAMAGLTPGRDEFKSSAPMEGDSRRQALRDSLLGCLRGTQLGLVVTPTFSRPRLGNEVLAGLEKIRRANLLDSRHHTIYLDQGIRIRDREKALSQFENRGKSRVRLEQDSRVVGGLQLADLASHILALLLRAKLGWPDKRVPAPPHYDFDSDGKLYLSDELQMIIRHRFFTMDEVDLSIDPAQGFMLKTGEYATHIASMCDDNLRNACNDCFGSTFVGCML